MHIILLIEEDDQSRMGDSGKVKILLSGGPEKRWLVDDHGRLISSQSHVMTCLYNVGGSVSDFLRVRFIVFIWHAKFGARRVVLELTDVLQRMRLS